MFYWIKQPGDGTEVDYNLKELRAAAQKGDVQPQWAARRFNEKKWLTVKELLATEKADDDDAPAKSPETAAPHPKDGVVFACVGCHADLETDTLAEGTSFSCPKCQTQYQTVKASDSPLVFLVLPKSS
jgi:hypothetical protein